MRDLHYLFLEIIWDEWAKIDAKDVFFQNTETSMVANGKNQEADDGLHILRVLPDLQIMEHWSPQEVQWAVCIFSGPATLSGAPVAGGQQYPLSGTVASPWCRTVII